MPLLSLSLEGCGIDDSGFERAFIKGMYDIHSRFSPMEAPRPIQNKFGRQQKSLAPQEKSKDYYRGGMSVNFSQNKLTFATFKSLAKLLASFEGLRSLNLSHQKTSLKTGSRGSNERVIHEFGDMIIKNNSMTHLDIRGIELTMKSLGELFRGFSRNAVLQEIKVDLPLKSGAEFDEMFELIT